jgi:heme-degrading monooxygenase HmoA
MMFANTPKPPYYAVIFTSRRSEGDNGYQDMSDKIESLVRKQPGYLGMESARNKIGITVCYWKDMESIQGWAENNDHGEAKEKGKAMWYEAYKVRICQVVAEY